MSSPHDHLETSAIEEFLKVAQMEPDAQLQDSARVLLQFLNETFRQRLQLAADTNTAERRESSLQWQISELFEFLHDKASEGLAAWPQIRAKISAIHERFPMSKEEIPADQRVQYIKANDNSWSVTSTRSHVTVREPKMQ